MAVVRIRINQQGVGNKHFKMYQLKEHLQDPMTRAFCFYALVADILNGGAVEVVALIVCGYLGSRFGHRILISMSGLCIAILGMLLIICMPLSKFPGRLAGYYLTQASPTPFVALLYLIASNVAGYTKKTTFAALYHISYCIGNIIGPQVFQTKDKPQYRPAEITIAVCWACCLADLLFIWWCCKHQNTKKAAIRARPSYKKLERQEFLDLTDRENPELVYWL